MHIDVSMLLNKLLLLMKGVVIMCEIDILINVKIK